MHLHDKYMLSESVNVLNLLKKLKFNLGNCSLFYIPNLYLKLQLSGSPQHEFCSLKGQVKVFILLSGN